MDNKSIVIKMADGSFYPVLEEGFKGRKKLVLTTVRDNQETVQINLYQNKNYIGSLVIENIMPASSGEPEIEVIIGIDKDNNLDAIASDLQTGNKQRLTSSLEYLGEEEIYKVPDFELNEELQPELTIANEKITDDKSHDIEDGDKEESHVKKKSNPLLRVVFILLGLLVIAGLTFFTYWLFNQNSTEVPPAIDKSIEDSAIEHGMIAGEDAAEDITDEYEDIPSETYSMDSEDPKYSTDDADSDEETAAAFTKKGIWYRIKRGDTLWDLSATYYRNPWLYNKIARHPYNNIKDPDYILAGFKLFIPEN